jgi:hypothetical protein
MVGQLRHDTAVPELSSVQGRTAPAQLMMQPKVQPDGKPRQIPGKVKKRKGQSVFFLVTYSTVDTKQSLKLDDAKKGFIYFK